MEIKNQQVIHPSLADATVCLYFLRNPFKGASGFFHAAFLAANSSSETSADKSLFTASMVMISPSFTRAILPPSYASGVIWPTTNPCVPPENLPSVIKATDFHRPAPMIREVGFSISGIPGPPLGPQYRMTITSPSLISLF